MVCVYEYSTSEPTSEVPNAPGGLWYASIKQLLSVSLRIIGSNINGRRCNCLCRYALRCRSWRNIGCYGCPLRCSIGRLCPIEHGCTLYKCVRCPLRCLCDSVCPLLLRLHLLRSGLLLLPCKRLFRLCLPCGVLCSKIAHRVAYHLVSTLFCLCYGCICAACDRCRTLSTLCHLLCIVLRLPYCVSSCC